LREDVWQARIALSDLFIRTDKRRFLQTQIATLVETQELAPEIRRFVFAVENTAEFRFAPGQFVSLTETMDGKPITRAYSIASTPNGNRFELCLNLVKDGRFSPHLFQMKPGDRVPMKGPVGTFTLRNPDRDAVFVATGTGIAPIRGIVRQAAEMGAAGNHLLLFGARHEYGLLYRDEFEALAKNSSRFRFEPTLTQPPASWRGRTGRVQGHLDELIGARKDLDVYICGLKEMVDSVRTFLKDRGFDRKQIIFEKYD
jgi:CDP-4-dehydro-6-deoxyglucose reductase